MNLLMIEDWFSVKFEFDHSEEVLYYVLMAFIIQALYKFIQNLY